MRCAGMRRILIASFGLRWRPSFLKDGQFHLALAAAPFPLLVLDRLAPGWSTGSAPGFSVLVAMVLWQPVIEELLFRGYVQGHLLEWRRMRARFAGISGANVCASMLFAAAHLLNHAPWWAVAVMLPSLVFGYFRERHGQVYPAILLHATYNACYLAFAARPAA